MLKPIEVAVERTANPGYYTVSPVWSSVDRPISYGITVPTRLIERMVRAFLSGLATPGAQVKWDVNGKSYVTHEIVVLGRKANADLKRLGF